MSKTLDCSPSSLTKYICIELPYLVSSASSALAVLGEDVSTGKTKHGRRVNSALSRDSDTIETSILTHLYDNPLVGQKRTSGGIILRIRRHIIPHVHRNCESNHSDDYSSLSTTDLQSMTGTEISDIEKSPVLSSSGNVEVVGFVHKSYSFTTPHDYQVDLYFTLL